jgi:hypothetical protein
MANTIGSLVIDLVANTAAFSTELSKATRAVEDTVSKMKSIFGGLAGVFSLTGIAELTKSTLEFGEQLALSAVKTGNSAQAISELAFAARQVNIDLPELTSGFEKMEKAISTAGTGNKAAVEAFNALGISFEQIQKLSPDQQFEEIANQISKLSDPTDRARASIAIFGKAGAELLPLFEQGAEGIEKARQKAIDFGASLDADQLKKLDDANKAVRDLGESFKALATTLVSKVAPGIAGFFDSITNAVTGNKAALLTKQIADMQERLDYIRESPGGGGPIANQLSAEIAKAQIALDGVKLAKQISDGLATGNALPDNKAPGFQAEIEPINITASKLAVSGMAKFYQELDDATKTGAEKVIDDTIAFQTKLETLYDDKKITAGLFAQRESAASDAADLASLLATNQVQIAQSIKQSADDMKESFKSVSDKSKLLTENMRADFEATANNAKNTAQGIQGAFETFLMNPFDGGLKKMLASWGQLLEQMAAKAAAQQIFKSLFPDSGGLGEIFKGLLLGGSSGGSAANVDLNSGNLPGRATGGSWKVGGTGGTDSQLVQFRASPDETVSVTTPGQTTAGRGVTVVNHNYIDARTDATQIAQMIAQSTRVAIQQSKSQMVSMVKRGAFA